MFTTRYQDHAFKLEQDRSDERMETSAKLLGKKLNLGKLKYDGQTYTSRNEIFKEILLDLRNKG